MYFSYLISYYVTKEKKQSQLPNPLHGHVAHSDCIGIFYWEGWYFPLHIHVATDIPTFILLLEERGGDISRIQTPASYSAPPLGTVTLQLCKKSLRHSFLYPDPTNAKIAECPNWMFQRPKYWSQDEIT